MDGARTYPPQPRTLGRPLRTVGPQKRRKYARVCVCPVCIISVSENSKSSIVRDSDESCTSVPPFHIIYTIETQKTERGGHQGRREARMSKAILRRISLVIMLQAWLPGPPSLRVSTQLHELRVKRNRSDGTQQPKTVLTPAHCMSSTVGIR